MFVACKIKAYAYMKKSGIETGEAWVWTVKEGIVRKSVLALIIATVICCFFRYLQIFECVA